MAGISNSPIQPWLDLKVDPYFHFNTEVIPATIPLCIDFPGKTPVNNCTQVCNSSTSVLENPNGLLTCGLWVTLIALNHQRELAYAMRNATDPMNEQYQDILKRFAILGLNASNETYVATTEEVVSTVFFMLLIYEWNQVEQDGRAPGLCSQQSLFPSSVVSVYNVVPTSFTQGIQDCMTAICAPTTLDPDLGGIGVFTSLFIQLGIPIIILVGLLCLNLRPLRNTTKNEDHMINLAIALVDFHRAQCYFITAIDIAVLVLVRQASGDMELTTTPAVFNIVVALPLALNGILPVAFSLSCIALYSRLSWHLILLSLVPIILSTGALASTYIWMKTYYPMPDLNFYRAEYLQAFLDLPEDLDLADYRSTLCGSSPGPLKNDSLGPWVAMSPIIWLIYTYCIAWTLWCIFTQISKHSTEEWAYARVLSKLKNFCLRWLRSVSKIKLAAYGYTISLLIWGLCFAYHFYLYGLFIRSDVVATEWSFGQIIAVTVWIPSIVELLYIEHEGIENGSKYRYPPGVQAFKTRHVVLEGTDSIQLIARTTQKAQSNKSEHIRRKWRWWWLRNS